MSKPANDLKLQPSSPAVIAARAVLMTLLLLNIATSIEFTARIRQDRELNQLRHECAAARSLPIYADIFRSSTAVNDPSFPIKTLRNLPEWKEFEDKLQGYTVRIELLEAQRLTTQHWLMYRLLVLCGLSLIAAVWVNVLNMRLRSARMVTPSVNRNPAAAKL